MKQLRVLLYREWRDQRTLCVVSLVACLLLSLTGLRIHGSALVKSWVVVDVILPVCCLAFAAVLATESITREAQSGVGKVFVRLPMSRPLVWIAKVLFVVLAVVSLILLLVPVDFVLSLAGDTARLSGDQVLVRPVFWSATGALAAASLAFACLLRRAIPAVVVAALTIGALPLVLNDMPLGRANDWLYVFLTLWSPGGLAALACAGFLLGSLFAFGVRRSDPLGLRRGLALLAGVVLVFVPCVSGSVREATEGLDIAFSSRTARITEVESSQDGNLLAVQMEQEWTASPAWAETAGEHRQKQEHRCEVWIFDRTRSTWSQIDDRYRVLLPRFYRGYERGPWDSRGRLSVASCTGAFGGTSVGVELIDPATSAVVFQTPPSISMMEKLDAETGLGAWYTTLNNTKKSEFTVRWKERGIDLTLADEKTFAASPVPGILFIERSGDLVRHEMESGCETRLCTPPFALHRGNGLRVSPDGRYIAISGWGATTIIDSSDGHTVAELPQGAWFQGWSHVARRLGLVCVSSRGQETGWCALDEDGELQPLPTSMPRCAELGPDMLLAYDGQRIECVSIDGSQHQVLYEARP